MATQQPIFSSTTAAANSSSVRYVSLQAGTIGWAASESSRYVYIPTNGTFKQLNVRIDTAPGAAKKWEFALSINGVASTTLILNIRDTNTEAVITADQSISAGDSVSIKCRPVGTPTAWTYFAATIVWEPTIDDEYLLFGVQLDTPHTSNTEYTPISSISSLWSTDRTQRMDVMPTAGAIKKVLAYLTSTPGAGNDYTIKVDVDGTPSTESIVLDNADFTKINTNTFANVSAGDTLTYQSVPTGPPTGSLLHMSCVFVPSTTGEIPLMAHSSSTLDLSGTEYNTFGVNSNWSATRATYQIEMVNTPITVTHARWKLRAVTGGGGYTFHFETDGTDESSLDVSIDGSSTTGDSGSPISVSVADAVKVNVKAIPVSSPTSARQAGWGFVYTFAGIATPAAEPAFATEVHTFTKDASGTNGSVDHITLASDFTPVAIRAAMIRAAAFGNSITEDGMVSLGVSDVTNDRCVSIATEDALGTSNADRMCRNDAILSLISTGGTAVDIGTIDSVGQGYVRIKWTTASTTAAKIMLVVVGGTDLSAEVGDFPSDTSTAQNVTTTIKSADFCQMISARQTAFNSVSAGGSIGYGITDGTNQGTIAISSEDGVGLSNTARYQQTDECISQIAEDASAVRDEAAITALDATDGIQINWGVNGGTAEKISYLLVKGCQVEVGSDTHKTTPTGTKQTTTGFTPEAVVAASYLDTAQAAMQTQSLIAIGASDGTRESAIMHFDVNNISTTESSTSANTDQVMHYSQRTPTDVVVGAFNSFDTGPDGFTIDYTTNDATARQFIYDVWAEAAAASTQEPIQLLMTGVG